MTGFFRSTSGARARAFSLTEVLIAIVVVCAAITPIFMAFSTSRKTVVAASGLSRAVSFASSYMTALREGGRSSLRETGHVEDTSLQGGLSLEKLGIDRVQQGFTRKLELRRASLAELPNSRLYHATVTVIWKNTAGDDASYVLEGLIDERL